jgi:ATP-binding cassette, subfamily B, heavy metal transporter
MINAMMIQLYQPLNFMGMVYREIKQAITDIEIMFGILSRAPRSRTSRRQAARVQGGTIRFEDVHFAYDPERPILKGVSFEVPAARPSPSSARRAPASRRSRGCCSASTTSPAAAS